MKDCKVTMPTKLLVGGNFEYRNSAMTNVQDTWRRFGWLPREEQEQQAIDLKKRQVQYAHIARMK